MDRCEFTGDFECLMGFKVWAAGHTCVQVPSPPAYHARGLSCADLGRTWDIMQDEFTKYRPWWPLAVERFRAAWPYENFGEAQKHYLETYVYPATEAVNHSEFMPHEEWKP